MIKNQQYFDEYTQFLSNSCVFMVLAILNEKHRITVFFHVKFRYNYIIYQLFTSLDL